MKKLIYILAFFFLAISAKSQSICVYHYCKDSVFLPYTLPVPIVARITTTDKILYSGWTQKTGTGTVSIGPRLDSVNIQFTTAGTFVFQDSIVTSKSKVVVYDTVVVVPAVNQVPVIVINDTAVTQSFFIIDLSKSFDPDGTIASYSVTGNAIVKQAGSLVVLGGLTPGKYPYTITLKDNSGATAAKIFTLTVNAPPVVPIKTVTIYSDGSIK